MKKVLVVEDEDVIRKGVIQSIDWTALGCEVVAEAENGRIALEMVKRHDPALIVTDIRMPDMDGLTFLKQLREQENKADVIVLTAYDNFEYIRSALRLGAVDYLLKPLEEKELEQIIRKLQKKRAAAPKQSAPQQKRKQEIANSYVRDAVQFIQRNYSDPTMCVRTVAEHLNISESYLSHLFKQETGDTVLQHLTACRLQHAKELLGDYRMKIYEVADAVGYRDVSYFAAVFRKATGVSPSDYQNALQAQKNPAGKPNLSSEIW